MKRYSIHSYYLLLISLFSLIDCDEKEHFVENKVRIRIDSILTNIQGIDFEYLSTIQNVKHVLPINKRLFSDIKSLTEIGNQVNQSFTHFQDDIPGLFYSAYQLLGAGAGGFGPPLRGATQGVDIKDKSRMLDLINNLNIIMKDDTNWERLPFSLQKEVIEFVYRCIDIKLILEQFSGPVMKHLSTDQHSNSGNLFEVLFSPWNQRELLDFRSIETVDEIDLKKLSFATRMLSEQLNAFMRFKDLKISAEFKRCTIHTSVGKILINGVQNDTIKGDYLMVLDLGGNDYYTGSSAYAFGDEHPLSIVVDFDGDDQYISKDGYLVSAILGIAVLLDLAGNDQYQTSKPGLAFSLYGSSMLYDYSGRDVYQGFKEYSQATAFVGTSIFFDRYGADNYNCRNYSQAFAGTYGAAVFFDVAGDDNYNSVSNSSLDLEGTFIQGASQGRWAEATDGQSLGGGIAVFMDNSGNDSYGALSFSQGASYYFGLGIFLDQDGEDHYNAISHSQGYAAHYSLASFSDYGGNDEYNNKTDSLEITQIVGSGRDHSIGVFSDYAGDDMYFFGNRSAGIGDLEGKGIFLDYGGRDSYLWHKNEINSGDPSVGQTIQVIEGMSTGTRFIKTPVNFSKGIFIDSNGDRIN